MISIVAFERKTLGENFFHSFSFAGSLAHLSHTQHSLVNLRSDETFKLTRINFLRKDLKLKFSRCVSKAFLLVYTQCARSCLTFFRLSIPAQHKDCFMYFPPFQTHRKLFCWNARSCLQLDAVNVTSSHSEFSRNRRMGAASTGCFELKSQMSEMFDQQSARL